MRWKHLKSKTNTNSAIILSTIPILHTQTHIYNIRNSVFAISVRTTIEAWNKKQHAVDVIALTFCAWNQQQKFITYLNEIIEDAEAFRIVTGLNIHQWPNLRSSKGDVFIAHHNLKLLSSYTIWFRPVVVIFLHNLQQKHPYITNFPLQIISVCYA